MVYQQVCAACHSLQHIPFRALVGVTHDVDGAKAFAAKYDIADGPNEQGEKSYAQNMYTYTILI